MLRAYTELEINALHRTEHRGHQAITDKDYRILKKINDNEYLVEPPKDYISITKQTRFLPVPKHKHDVIELAYMYPAGPSIL
jgi:hypothetical protein